MSEHLNSVVERALKALEDAFGTAGHSKPVVNTAKDTTAAMAVELAAAQPMGNTAEGRSCPGPELCGGCYSVGVIDGHERVIHPPRGKQWIQ